MQRAQAESRLPRSATGEAGAKGLDGWGAQPRPLRRTLEYVMRPQDPRASAGQLSANMTMKAGSGRSSDISVITRRQFAHLGR